MDRNDLWQRGSAGAAGSLSARRAWIEIHYQSNARRSESVALRKESVDRNFPPGPPSYLSGVALRKESVDRNIGVGTTRDRRGGRSPQGERG